MKRFFILLVCLCVLLTATAAFADDGFKVTYLPNDCLAEVPTDETVYAEGTDVTVLFEPVAYKDYLIFYGWDMNNDGIADFGYNYKNFVMPANDVELKAICISAGSVCPRCPGCHHVDFRPVAPIPCCF